MPYLKHTLTTNSIHVWGEDMIGKVCLKKNKNLPLSELREALQFFYRTISSPQVMSSQELSEGSSGWSGDVQLGQWAVVINLYICFSGSKKTKLVLLLASRKKATQRSFQVSVEERYRAASHHLWAILSCTHRWHIVHGALQDWQH